MQTTVDTNLVIGFPGMKADSGFDDVLTREAKEDVAFGKGLVEGVGAGESILPAASGFKFDGVALHTHTVELDGDEERKYEAEDAMSVLRRGRVYVVSEDAVSIGDGVFLRHTAGGLATELPGNFRTDADGGDAGELSGCRWLTTTSSTFALALLEINYI